MKIFEVLLGDRVAYFDGSGGAAYGDVIAIYANGVVMIRFPQSGHTERAAHCGSRRPCPRGTWLGGKAVT